MTQMDKKKTKPDLLGRSYDGRTNRWRVTCPECGNKFEPKTQISAIQYLDCPKPKCNAAMVARYNDEPATVELI